MKTVSLASISTHLHVCPGCEDGIATGITLDGEPSLCKSCENEKELGPVEGKHPHYQPPGLNASGLLVGCVFLAMAGAALGGVVWGAFWLVDKL